MKISVKIRFFVICWALGIICHDFSIVAAIFVWFAGFIFYKTRRLKLIFAMGAAFSLGFLRICIWHWNGNDVASAGNAIDIGFITNLRYYILDAIGNVFNEPASGLMAGLLLGARKSIPYEILQNFNKIGLTHILAISGWNITLIIGFVAGIFGFLGRKLKVIVALLAIMFFVLLVSGGASVLRASIMGAIGLLAMMVGRENLPSTALFASGFFMTLFSPDILTSDVGFQLSFLSTMGLIYFMPVLSRFCAKIPVMFGARDIIISTLSSQVFIMPIAMSVFNRISIIAPIANLFILPLIPVIMLFAFVAIIVGIIFEPAGRLIAVLPELMSKFIFWISDEFSKLSFAYFDVYQIPTIAIALYFCWILYLLIHIDMLEA